MKLNQNEGRQVPECYNCLNVFQQKHIFVKEDFLSQRSNNFSKVNFKSENMIFQKCSFLCFL